MPSKTTDTKVSDTQARRANTLFHAHWPHLSTMQADTKAKGTKGLNKAKPAKTGDTTTGTTTGTTGTTGAKTGNTATGKKTPKK